MRALWQASQPLPISSNERGHLIAPDRTRAPTISCSARPGSAGAERPRAAALAGRIGC